MTEKKEKLDNIYFHDTWVLWSHETNDNDYSISSYSVLWEIDNMNDFLRNMDLFKEDTWCQKMYFFMRKGVSPRYEDPKNVKGGSWSYRVNKNYCYTSWFSLCLQCMGECLFENLDVMQNINGVSLSPKNNTTTIRIWTSLSNESYLNTIDFKYQIPNIEQTKALFRRN